MKDPILEVNNLRVSFRTYNGKVQAVRGIDFKLFEGETLAIVGESGSGKSVTTKAILGILPKNSIIEEGEILYKGDDLTKYKEKDFYKIRGKEISLIFQDPLSALNPIMKIGKQITEALVLREHMTKEQAKKRAIELMGKPASELKIVVCHLGNGSSLSAVADGKCQDTSMGLSPLADAVMDAVQGGAARVFCIPVAASTAGTIGEVTKTGDGGGSVTVQGSPNNAYALTVRFTAQGGLNTAAFVYSIDGDNFSDEITVPVTGSYEIEGTGLTIKFAEASSPDQKPSSFLVRDTYTLKTTAPSMTNGDVLGAIEKIKSFNEEFEFVHIVGESTVELWEAVSEAQKELMTVCHKPCFFLMEAAYPADEADGDLSDWALKMEADRKRIKNSDIQVCAAWGRLVRLDGTTQIVNLAGLASGRYAMTKVSVSIGKTKDEDALGFPKTKLLELVPIGYDSTVIELLDVAGYMTFREYDGLDDIFVYHTKMMCKDGSDFRYAEDVRVKNKIIRETRKKALQFKNDDIDLEDIQGELDARAKFISVPLDRMVEDKEISSYETTVDESCYDTFLEDETMSVIIRYLSRGYIREVVIDIGRSALSSN